MDEVERIRQELKTFRYKLRKSLKNQFGTIVVRGVPGGEKTRTVLDIAREIKTPKVYVGELKKLVNYVVKYIKDELNEEAVRIRSKYEVCDTVREALDNKIIIKFKDPETGEEIVIENLNYLITVLKTCLSCDVDKCPFYDEIRQVFSEDKFVCMTSAMFSILSMFLSKVFEKKLIIFDEVDWVFRQALTVIDYSIVKQLKELAIKSKREEIREGVRRFLRNLVPVFLKDPSKYAVKLRFPEARYVLISATLPDSLVVRTRVFFPPKQAIFSMPTIIKDYFWVNLEKINVMHIKSREYVPIEERTGALLRVIEQLYDTYNFKVCICSPKYEVTKALKETLETSGFRTFTDLEPEELPGIHYRDKCVIVITIAGETYRGVSLCDCEAILCLYQRHRNYPPFYPDIHSIIIEDLDPEEIDTNVAKVINDCINVQTYFRTNRIRLLPHLVYFLDLRSYTAFKEVFQYYKGKAKWYSKFLNARKVWLRSFNIREVMEDLDKLYEERFIR